MKITFEDQDNGLKFEADNVITLEDAYYKIKGGIIAMGFSPENAEELIEEMRGDES